MNQFEQIAQIFEKMSIVIAGLKDSQAGIIKCISAIDSRIDLLERRIEELEGNSDSSCELCGQKAGVCKCL